MNQVNQIKAGAILSYATILLSVLAGLLYTPWMVRQIGISDYGLYALTGAFLSYFLMDFGLGSAIARFLAVARAEGDTTQTSHLLGITLRLSLILDGVIFLSIAVCYLFLEDIFGELTAAELVKFKTIYLIAGLFSIITFPFTPLSGALIAYEQFVPLKLLDLIQRVVTVLLVIIVLLAGYRLYALVFVTGLTGFSVTLCKYIYLIKKMGLTINLHSFNRFKAREMLSFSFWVFLIGIAQRLLLNIVPTLLGILSGTREIALFSIAMTIEAYTWSIANALNGLFIPQVARMSECETAKEDITNLMIRVGRLQLLVSGFILTGFIVFGKAFILLWMGSAFETSYYVALFLILPGFITLTQEIAYTLLFVVNELKYRAVLFIGASLVSLGIGIWLAPRFGAIGAATGVGVALLLCHIIGMNVVYSRILGLGIRRFFTSCHQPMLAPMLIAGTVSLLIQYLFPIQGWVAFILSGSLFTALFFLFMWYGPMNLEEKTLLVKLVKRLSLQTGQQQ